MSSIPFIQTVCIQTVCIQTVPQIPPDLGRICLHGLSPSKGLSPSNRDGTHTRLRKPVDRTQRLWVGCMIDPYCRINLYYRLRDSKCSWL